MWWSFGWMCCIYLFTFTNRYVDAAIINKHTTVTENFTVRMSYRTVQTKRKFSAKHQKNKYIL
jgi:hypothetical protein